MQHKLMVLFTMLVLLSFMVVPAGVAQAQEDIPGANPACPPLDSNLMQDRDFLHSLPFECVKAFKTSHRETNFAEQEQNIEPMAANQPDNFGYIYNSIARNWITATTNSGLTGDDEYMGPVDIGFSFPFYGATQTQLYFNTNGLITFGEGSWQWAEDSIPNDVTPNNLIAPFWEDLLVGSPYNYGGIYYSRGGSAPNRYFVVEWRGVQNYGGGQADFEAILYENGDIVVNYGNIPSPYYSTVGIEDSTGHQGLQYQHGDFGVFTQTAVRFSYPTTPVARVLAYAPQPSGFVPLNRPRDFPIVVTNTGVLGTDTYDLNTPLNWSGTYYAADGVTLLSDTDGDSKIDTGAIPQGAATTILVRYIAPANAIIGNRSGNYIEVTSSLNSSVKNYVNLTVQIAMPFANVLMDGADGAMSILTASPNGVDRHKASPDNYFGSDVAAERLPDRNSFYAWAKGLTVGGNWAENIEYALLNHQGTIIGTPFKLTNNVGGTLDDSPSIAVAPNGIVGILWRRYLYDNATGKFNYNVYFATLNASGTLLTGPTNITNVTAWGGPGIYNLPQYYNPTIAATSDNRFILGWGAYWPTNSSWVHNVWYSVRNADGNPVLLPKMLVSTGVGGSNMHPVLNTLTGGKVIMTWGGYGSGATHGPYYAVLSSNGSVVKPATALNGYVSGVADAVQLPSGRIVIAWITTYDVGWSSLNSLYNLESGPNMLHATEYGGGYDLSVTPDSADRVAMTWMYGSNKQLYAMLNFSGLSAADPMIYNTSSGPIDMSSNGQGSVPFEPVEFIEGNTGVGWVTLSYTNGTPQTITSDGAGNYSIEVPAGWSGTITPSHPCYAFGPGDRTYSNLTANQTSQNFTPTFNNAPVCAVTTGVFRPSNGLLYLKNSNTTGFADVALNYGLGGDYPVVGDWDGNGTATIGVYRDGSFYLRNSNTLGFAEVVFPFGNPGDQPIAGDWDGDGVDTIGVFHPSNGHFFLRNSNTEGTSEMDFYLGNPGDVGIAGDWDGDGKDTTGVFRPTNGLLYLKNKNDTGFADYALNYGLPGDMPVTGDWDNDGIDTIGVYRQGQFMLRNSNTLGFAEVIFGLGNPGDMPIAGNWDGRP